MKRFIFISILLLAVASSMFGQKPTSKVLNAEQLLNDIKLLSADDMEGRSADRPAMEKARAYIEKRFKESGIEPFGGTYRTEFEMKRRNSEPLRGVNIVGSITGKKFPAKYIVITAHYDHLGVVNGQTFNGADDNASGTSALFAIAAYFKKHQPEHSLIFVAFDGEEKGLVGARHFVTNPPVSRDAMLMNVNMDMISRNTKDELYAAGTLPYPQLKAPMIAAQKKARVKLMLGHDDPKTGHDDWTSQSDQGVFHGAKIPFIYFGVEDHKDYHKATDDFERIMPDFYVRAVETIIGAITALDNELK